MKSSWVWRKNYRVWEANRKVFGRSEVADSHDPLASADVAYLLKRIEEFDGLVILTSNAKLSTVERRFDFVIDLAA